jgi:SAM-dependent methyltransferase
MNLKALSRGAWAVSGVDASEAALKLARRRGAFPLRRAFLEALPFPSASFDLIYSMDVVYMLTRPRLDAAFSGFHRILKPGGRLLLHSATLGWLRSTHDEAVATVERYGKAYLEERLAFHGFKLERSTYRMFLLFPLVALGKLLQKRRVGLGPEEGAKGDVEKTHPLLNALLFPVLRLENFLLRFMNLPIGSSVFLVAKKGRSRI